ncbi:MAG: DUF6596 domain-containing protein [Planctomycetota bacterium]
MLDRQRHGRRQDRLAATLRAMAVAAAPFESAEAFPDERLRLFFVSAHPAIDSSMHAPLILQVVLGLDAARIAPAFLTSPAAMSQRLVRTKTKIREAAIPFDVPEEHELPPRLASVLEAIYATYGLGWDAVHGADADARDLADEAIWLARVLAQRLPDEPEAHALLALLLFCESRRAARRDARGDYVPLSAQDPARWSEPLIREAETALAAAAGHGRHGGRFQLEAAIQSVHADRRRTGCTDWRAILLFYEHLVAHAPTLAAHIGRAIAVAEVGGAEAGLQLLDGIDPALAAMHQPFHAARAHLLQRLGRSDEAARALELAIGLAQDAAVRRFLLRHRA